MKLRGRVIDIDGLGAMFADDVMCMIAVSRRSDSSRELNNVVLVDVECIVVLRA